MATSNDELRGLIDDLRREHEQFSASVNAKLSAISDRIGDSDAAGAETNAADSAPTLTDLWSTQFRLGDRKRSVGFNIGKDQLVPERKISSESLEGCDSNSVHSRGSRVSEGRWSVAGEEHKEDTVRKHVYANTTVSSILEDHGEIDTMLRGLLDHGSSDERISEKRRSSQRRRSLVARRRDDRLAGIEAPPPPKKRGSMWLAGNSGCPAGTAAAGRRMFQQEKPKRRIGTPTSPTKLHTRSMLKCRKAAIEWLDTRMPVVHPHRPARSAWSAPAQPKPPVHASRAGSRHLELS